MSYNKGFLKDVNVCSSRDVRAAGTYDEVRTGFHHICTVPIKGADSLNISLFVVTKKFDIPAPLGRSFPWPIIRL